MEPAAADRPRPVTIIGWILLILALLRLIEGAVGYGVWRLGGLKEGLPIAAHFGVGSPGHLHLVDAILRNLGPIIAGQVVVAAFAALAAWNLLRLRPWARIAVEGICWASIAIVWSFTVLFVVSWERAAAGVPGEQAARLRVWGPVVAFCAALLVGGLLGVVIWILRRPEVRRAFRPVPDLRPSAP